MPSAHSLSQSLPPDQYWRQGYGLGNITPKDDAWPEGPAFAPLLQAMVGDCGVLDFGCGWGRLAPLFAAESYIGTDISLDVLRLAVSRTGKRFAADLGGPLPAAAVTLCHTVLLHVPDADLPALIARFSSPRVIVSEILGRQWRRAGNPPVFNREVADYEAAFRARGYRLLRREACEYRRYGGVELSILEFGRE